MGTKVIPREVGKLNTFELRRLRYNFQLTEIQKSLIVGTLLGDGCLIPNSWGNLYRLQIEQGLNQKDYLFWKYKIIKNLVLTEPKYQKVNNSWKFRTGSHPEFTYFAKLFYDNDRNKIVPQNIAEYLRKPLVLAIWYMDDGGLRREKQKIYGAFLNTQSFSFQNNKLLQKVLWKEYGMETLLLRNRRKFRIYIPRRSLNNLKIAIRSYIHSSMIYKLP